MKYQKNENWEKHQKEIADDNYYLARSCIRQNFFPAAEDLFMKILANDLGKNIFDDPRQTTCTGIAYHSGVIPFETTMTVVARQFALMTEAGFENFVCSCVTSFGIYSEVIETWQHFPEKEKQAREILKQTTGMTFEIPKNLAHTSDLIYKFRNEIAAKATYRLLNKQTGEQLKVVDHVGCHYAKIFPEKGVGGAEFPYVLAGMIDAWGGAQVDYPERRHCCGFGFRQYLLKSNRGYSVANSKMKFDSMEPYKPDCIIANCPGCTYFLDRWQYVIAEMEGITYGENGMGIPVLTYEELAGLLLGYDPWDIGLQVHQVAVEPLLDKLGIQYDAVEKYKGINHADLGQPEKPSVLKV
ncbi:MAG: heterodisulfide reductase subunit B [Bacteroidetes bacterium GWF2_43_63]|nr:MAG: heterodisulfide reductase subunit B [Bacteroidetes bacterium GWE2_42_42]OFY55991.1 MAG: heterodisulfide reductase subunit B [Bacteroidetes bacterium GWF2_43_63]HBG70770.1 heterodisulfide reductase subunit B [Bacteroidales bacterium]HCB62402.1 heterodisulfide reductase subunit B [Bacteroidales bacterium]HCY21857.1 heterodisulfide reductase subunit B [Bacteroidales bacterium]